MQENLYPEACIKERKVVHSILPSLLLLVSIECAWILLLGILQNFDTGMGVAIWPNNDDANYYMMLEAGGTKGIPTLFWAFDNRNPINPWFWVLLLSTVNYSQGYELFIASQLVDLILGFAVFMLLDTMTCGRCRIYSLAAGIAVLIWPFARTDHVNWVFNLALAMSVFNLYCYCMFLQGNRQNGRWLATGLLLYFLTISTYTLHLWGILAIPFLSLLLYQQNQPNRGPWYYRFGSGCVDLIWYILFFVTFMLIWDTTSPYAAPARNYMKLTNIAKQLPASLSYLVLSWNDRSSLYQIIHHRNWFFVLSTCAFFASVYSLIFYKIIYKKTCIQSLPGNIYPSLSQMATSLVMIAALSAGVVQIESTTTIWAPGTRTPMVQKVVQPCLLITTIFIITHFIPSRIATLRNFILVMSLTCICLTGSMVALFKNSQKWQMTKNHTNLLNDIIKSPEIANCTCENIIIILDKTTERFLPTFQIRKYLAPRLHPHIKSIAFISHNYGQTKLINYKSVIFDDGNKGIALRLPKQIDGFTIVPYKNTAFFRYNPKGGVCHIHELHAIDLENTDAHILRKDWPIHSQCDNQ